jgi:hypothetical protein
MTDAAILDRRNHRLAGFRPIRGHDRGEQVVVPLARLSAEIAVPAARLFVVEPHEVPVQRALSGRQAVLGPFDIYSCRSGIPVRHQVDDGEADRILLCVQYVP